MGGSVTYHQGYQGEYSGRANTPAKRTDKNRQNDDGGFCVDIIADYDLESVAEVLAGKQEKHGEG